MLQTSPTKAGKPHKPVRPTSERNPAIRNLECGYKDGKPQARYELERPRVSGAVDGSERWTSLPTSLKIYSCCHWLSVALKSRNYRIFRAKQSEGRALLPCVCSQQAEVSHESWSWTFSEPPVCPQSTVILNYPAIYSFPQGALWQRNPSQSVCTPLSTLNSSHVCVSEVHFLQHWWLISPVSHRAGLPLCKHKRHTGNTWTQRKTKAGTKSANNSIPIKDH